MKDSLVHLIAVQVLDERVAILTRRLESLPVELGEREARNKKMCIDAEALEADRMHALSKCNSLENDASDLQDRIEKLETQQRSLRDAGAVAVAAHEAEECRARMGRAEDDALQQMDIAEKLEPEIAEARDLLAEDVKELEMFRETVARDQVDLQEEIAGLQARRDERIPSINRSLVDHYVKLMPSRKGKPMAALRGESCGGCGMSVPANDQLKVKAGKAVTTCRSCQRILIEHELWTSVREATEV